MEIALALYQENVGSNPTPPSKIIIDILLKIDYNPKNGEIKK